MRPTSDAIIQVLNPADHFTLAMDEEIRQEGMPGSLCGIALELEGRVNNARLRERIEHFCRNFPVSKASLQQHGRRFYWCKREHPREIFYLHDYSEGQDGFHAGILKIMNRPQVREEVNPLEFHLFHDSTDSTLLMRWIHPFCDAVGADLILKYLVADVPPAESASNGGAISLLNEQLARFSLWQKFRLLLKAKRLIEQIDEFRSILPRLIIPAPERLNFRNFRLDIDQSRKIAEASRKHVGLIGASLYPLGCLMRAIERMGMRSDGEAYCVPYAFNLRKQKAMTPVIGNHVSALFGQAPLEVVGNRDLLFKHLTDQYRHAIRNQLDFAFLPLMWAAQWMPLERYGRTLRQSYSDKRERTSFWLSDIGRSDLAKEKIFGASITGLVHLTQVSTPPGIALLICGFGGSLSLTYNFIEPMYDADWIERLHGEVVAELLGEIP